MKFLSCLTWLTGDLIVVNIILSELVLGSFLLKGRLKFIRGHLVGEILLEFWETSEIFCLHLSSLVEQGAADLIANIQAEIGPHRHEKSTWHQRLSIFPYMLFLCQSQVHKWFYISVHSLEWEKKMLPHILLYFSPLRCISKSSFGSLLLLRYRQISPKQDYKNTEFYLPLKML